MQEIPFDSRDSANQDNIFDCLNCSEQPQSLKPDQHTGKNLDLMSHEEEEEH